MSKFFIIVFCFCSVFVHAQTGDDYNEKGLMKYAQQNYREAIEFFSKSIALNDDDVEAHVLRSLSYFKLKEYKIALKDFGILIERYPNNSDLRVAQGVIYLEIGKTWNAIDAFVAATKLDTLDDYAFNYLGVCFDDLAMVDQALENYSKAIHLDSKVVDYHYNRGLLYESIGDYRRAAYDYKIMTELESENSEWYFYLGVAYLEGEREDKACSTFQKAAELENENAITLLPVLCPDSDF